MTETEAKRGRPALGHVNIQVKVKPELAAVIRDLATANKLTQGQVIQSWHDKANKVDQIPNKA